MKMMTWCEEVKAVVWIFIYRAYMETGQFDEDYDFDECMWP